MKYIKKFNNHNGYATFVDGGDYTKPNVSLCVTQNEIHFNHYVNPQPLDILYSDANGNLSFTSEILPTSKGKTPIGLCVAGTDFFGTNEPARWISLKFMDPSNPDTGSVSLVTTANGCYRKDVTTITNIQLSYVNGVANGSIAGYNANSKQSYQEMPSLLDGNGNWNLTELGEKNQYAVTDVNGKNKTAQFLLNATSQSNWRTASAITAMNGPGYAVGACCSWRYHTLGTKKGDWYIGGAGEYAPMIINYTNILNKLQDIAELYPNDCFTTLGNFGQLGALGVITSTEYDSDNIYFVGIPDDQGKIAKTEKRTSGPGIALLQY